MMVSISTIITVVGTERRTVDAGIYFDAFEELVEHYKFSGLHGHALDVAVREALPSKLLQLVGNAGKPH